MKSKKIQIFATTLRDGTQGAAISLPVDDKLKIARQLDEFGVDYIEAGRPLSNPGDFLFFQKAAQKKICHARLKQSAAVKIESVGKQIEIAQTGWSRTSFCRITVIVS